MRGNCHSDLRSVVRELGCATQVTILAVREVLLANL